VETELGAAAVKVALWGEAVLKVSPEHDSLAALAERHGLPLGEVRARVDAAIRKKYGAVGE
jgi:uncharacterized protein (DUF111 family)